MIKYMMGKWDPLQIIYKAESEPVFVPNDHVVN